MVDFLFGLGAWNWFILGAVLLGLEIVAPGAFMLWFGLSALIVGVLSLVFTLPWQVQLLGFALFSVVSILLWRRFGGKAEEVREQPFLNRRTEGFVGREFTLEKPIVNGDGSVRIGDTWWRVRGPDAPAGTRVVVTDVDGALLIVRRVE